MQYSVPVQYRYCKLFYSGVLGETVEVLLTVKEPLTVEVLLTVEGPLTVKEPLTSLLLCTSHISQVRET